MAYEEEYLAHYGVKGMKWGVRRDAQLLASRRKKNEVKSAKSDLYEGKTTKEEYKAAKKQASANKKKFLSDLKKDYESADSQSAKNKISNSIQKQTLNEVSNRSIKKGVSIANNIYHAGSSAVNIGAAVVSSLLVPEVALLFATSAAINVAYNIGENYLVDRIVDATA